MAAMRTPAMDVPLNTFFFLMTLSVYNLIYRRLQGLLVMDELEIIWVEVVVA
jgi:hypothetical protein